MSIDPTGNSSLLPFATPPRAADAGAPAMFRSLAIAASGLEAQRLRMEVATQNIANADVTKTPGGGPYRRRVVELGVDAAASDIGTPGAHAQDAAGVKLTGVNEDHTPGPRVYDPGHPDAGPDGYVELPNVRATDELVSLLESRRLYEANATVFEVAKATLHRALDI
jgi:flagellar basal-body rod protein FlgC